MKINVFDGVCLFSPCYRCYLKRRIFSFVLKGTITLCVQESKCFGRTRVDMFTLLLERYFGTDKDKAQVEIFGHLVPVYPVIILTSAKIFNLGFIPH